MAITRTPLLTLSLVLLLGLTACDSSGSSGNAWFGPGSGLQPGATAPPGGGGPNDDHGNDINSATFMQGNPAGKSANGSGGIDYAADQDFFQVYLDTTGATTVTFATATAGDTYLALLDAGGNQIAANDDEDVANNLLNSKIELTGMAVPPTGFYFLVVSEGAAAIGTLPIYSVTVTNP